MIAAERITFFEASRNADQSYKNVLDKVQLELQEARTDRVRIQRLWDANRIYLITRAERAEARVEQVNAELQTVYGGESWRITYPLRLAGQFLRWLQPRIVSWITFAPDSRPRRIHEEAAHLPKK